MLSNYHSTCGTHGILGDCCPLKTQTQHGVSKDKDRYTIGEQSILGPTRARFSAIGNRTLCLPVLYSRVLRLEIQ